jgi:hypothetical protein
MVDHTGRHQVNGVLRPMQNNRGREKWHPTLRSAIVLGTGVGRLVECERLEPGAVGDPAGGPVIALVWGADGDEVGRGTR